MATENTFIWDRSFIAASDLSSLQYYIVSSSAAGYCDLCTASSGAIGVVTRPYGVLQNNPTSGHAATVRRLGASKVVASSSGAISISSYVACSTAGMAMTATTGCVVIGVAMSATTGASGQLLELDMIGPFLYQTAGATA
jgi:hypothetical protein